MAETLQQLISERGFDRYRPGLESRFAAHGLIYRIRYSDVPLFPSIFVSLENQERAGEMIARESGHCDLTALSFSDRQFKDRHVVLESAEGFHEQLTGLFLYVTKGEWTPSGLGSKR